MSTFSGACTGEGTPLNQRTGRRQTYRSSIWRSATLSERMPPPIGVVSGPLIDDEVFAAGRDGLFGQPGVEQVVRLLAGVDLHPVDLALAAVGLLHGGIETRTEARQMSGPVPSPSMKGMIGWSGTLSLPFWIVIFWPCAGTLSLSAVDIDGLRKNDRKGEFLGGECYHGGAASVATAGRADRLSTRLNPSRPSPRTHGRRHAAASFSSRIAHP